MTTKRLVLGSSSRVHGSGYLDHLEPFVVPLFGPPGRILFVPYALHDLDGYAASARERFAEMGIELESIHQAGPGRRAVERAAALFIGGGNTFRLLDRLQRENLIGPIRDRVESGAPYLGTSAGANVAGPTIKTTNDMPIVHPATLDALGLVPFQINPHYLDADPASTHMGETRDARLREYHEENATPVVALREGALLVVEGSRVTLEGEAGGKLFRRGREPQPLAAGTRVDALLAEPDQG